jgi:acyl carrier protein
MNTITNQVKSIIREIMPQNIECALHPSHKLSDLDMHDVDKVTLAMELERAFKISIPDNTAKSWITIQHVIQHVRREKLRQASYSLEESKRRRKQNPKPKTQKPRSIIDIFESFISRNTRS